MTAAFVLALMPVSPVMANAGAPPPDVTQPGPTPQPETPPPDSTPPTVAQPDAAPAGPERGEFEPVEIIPVIPEPEPEPMPEPEPLPVEPPVEPPPAVEEGPSPEEIAKIRTTRRAGIGLMATGGAVAAAGLGVTIAFTILGSQAQNVDIPVTADIEQRNSSAQIGGILLASGIAVVAVGGIIFATAKRKAESQTTARVRMAPAIGGLVLSGRF